MSAPSGFPPPQDLRNNPFAQRPPQNNPSFPIHNNGPAFPRPGPSFPIPRRDYDAESDMSDHYNSMNSSTTRLAGAPAFYEQSSGKSLSPPLPLFTTLLSGDTGSEIYGRRYDPSVDSHASIPSISPYADPGLGSTEHYPAWSADRQIPMSTEEIEDIFLDLTQKFGFQRDSMRNMVCFLPFPSYFLFIQKNTLLPCSSTSRCIFLTLAHPV